MSKSVSGIKNSNNRSVRDIDPHRENCDQSTNQKKSPQQSSGQPPRRSRNQKAATYGMWFIGIVILFLLFFLFSVLFAETTVTVTPRTAPISIDGQFTAVPSGTGTSSADTLHYTATSLQETRSQLATSTGTEYRQENARGQMRVINENSQESIQLVANTRFRSPSGNIYRTQSAVSVPGMSGGQPGETTVSVVADSPGREFNVDQGAEFAIPGFAGTPQEGEVYGRSATAIDGGIDREVPLVGTSTRNEIAQSLRSDLQQTLRSTLRTQISDTEVVYEDGQFFQMNTTASTTDTGQAEVTVTGSLEVLTFDRRALSIYLANQSGINADADTNLTVQDLEDYSFDITDDEFTPSNREQVSFAMNGDSLVVWQYNKQALSRDLQGLQKNQVTDVLDNYPSIQSATVNTRPFWKRSLPTDQSDITIKTNIPADNSR